MTAPAVVPGDRKPSKKQRVVKSAAKPPDPGQAAPAPSVVRIVRSRPKSKAKAKAKPPGPDPAPEVMTTQGGGGGPGPDDQQIKKVKQESKTPGGSRKRGKPEQEMPPEEEQRKPILIIESPGKAKTPDVIATVRSAVKAKALDDDLLNKFLAIGIPNAADEQKINMNREDELTLKEIYKEGVWKKAKVNISGGGGRFAPIY
jgi:hypothetical protein